MTKGVLLCAVLLLTPVGARAQALDVGDVYEAYLRLLQISGEGDGGSFSIRPYLWRADDPPPEVAGPWSGRFHARTSADLVIDPFEARVRTWVNTAFPSIQNDGAVWQGKGLTTSLELGTSLRWKGLRAAIRPSLIHARNGDFDLAPVLDPDQSEFGYPWRRIDLPQRMGDGPYTRLDPGQSEIRVSGFGVTAGVSTRNLWWGPGIQNSITLSNNAAGVPHAFLGTGGARNIGIGTLEASWIWGRLSESGWFTLPTDTDERFLTGLIVAYSPAFLDGLSVGATRMFFGAVPADGVPVSDYFLVLQGITKQSQATPGNPSGDDDRDQMVSLFGRWVLSESGFEVYGEWSRNDHSANLLDFLLEPEHSQGYTLGLQKALQLSEGRRLGLRAELTHLEREATFRVRDSPIYYAHHIVTQGYTHHGQVVGAGIGPGGNQQHIGVDLYDSWGRLGVVLQRRVADNDAYYEWALANDAGPNYHDVSFDAGLSGVAFVGDLEIEGGLIFTRQLYRNFFGDKVNNVNLSAGVRWRPGLR